MPRRTTLLPSRIAWKYVATERKRDLRRRPTSVIAICVHTSDRVTKDRISPVRGVLAGPFQPGPISFAILTSQRGGRPAPQVADGFIVVPGGWRLIGDELVIARVFWEWIFPLFVGGARFSTGLANVRDG